MDGGGLYDWGKLDSVTLGVGSHCTRESGMCLLEAIAWITGEKHTDEPACVCPVVGAFGIALNDAMGLTQRQRLKACAPAMVGTRIGIKAEQRRAYRIFDWAVREILAEAFVLHGYDSVALIVRGMDPIVDVAALTRANDLLRSIRRNVPDSEAHLENIVALAVSATDRREPLVECIGEAAQVFSQTLLVLVAASREHDFVGRAVACMDEICRMN